MNKRILQREITKALLRSTYNLESNDVSYLARELTVVTIPKLARLEQEKQQRIEEEKNKKKS